MANQTNGLLTVIATGAVGVALGFALAISQINGWKESAYSFSYLLKKESCFTQYWKARALQTTPATTQTFDSCVAGLGPVPSGLASTAVE